MSLPLSFFRGHFFKHLASRSSAASFFTFRGGASLNHFSSAYSMKREQLPESKVTAAACSSQLPNNFTSTSDDPVASPYLSVRIFCPRNAADGFSECLMCFGASSATVDVLDTHDDDKEVDENGNTRISSIFNIDVDVKDCISRASDSVGLEEMPNFEVEMLDHIDWIRKTKEPEAINIILNPGLAFGTGEHPTTKLCLLELIKLIKGGERFLDYGTGSGLLAIAALKLGAAVSVGFDIEPQAITATRSNATLNSIGQHELLATLVPINHNHHFEGELPPSLIGSYDEKLISKTNIYDVVIANILLHPLLDLADRIVSYTKPGATVCVSGIISEQVPMVMQRYSPLLENMNVSMMEDWACIRGTKKIATE